MRSWTGIELSPSRCSLVRVRRGSTGLRIGAFEVFQHTGRDSSELGTELGRALESGRFPRRARVVLWGIRSFHKLLLLPPEIASSNKRVIGYGREELRPFDRWANDASYGLTRESRHAAQGSMVAVLFAAASRADIAARVEPLRSAGFRVESVVTPALALAKVARTRTGAAPGSVTAFLALNRDGGAVAIVSGGHLLFTWDLAWEYRTTDQRQSVNKRLLERYLFISRIAPELHRAFESVEQTFGFSVDRVVTCGDLPDLRSLTVPLIEEFDVEVDTLDSTEGVDVTTLSDGQDVFLQQIAALRVVCSVAAFPPLVNLAPADAGRSAFQRVGIVAAGAAGASLTVAAGYAFWLAGEQITPPALPGKPPAHTVPATIAPPGPSGDESAAQLSDNAPALFDTGSAIQTRDARTEGGTVALAAVPDPVVQFILYSTDRRLAVVDGQMVGVGDSIGPFSVVDIAPDVVVLNDRTGNKRRVGIKDPYAQPRTR